MEAGAIPAGFWLVLGSDVVQVSTATHCPQCERPHFCSRHQYVYRGWIGPWATSMGVPDLPAFRTKTEAQRHRDALGR